MKVLGFDIEKTKQGIANSDENAFKDLFEYFYPKLLSYAFVIVKNHETAEDIVLEVFNSVWKRRDKLMGIDRFESYLYVSTKNRTINQHRLNSRFLFMEFDKPHYEEFISHQNPETRLLNKELFSLVDEVVLELPEKTRLVYRLIKEDGLKYQEVADLLGVSVKTVNNQLLSAMKSIRMAVTKYLDGEKRNPYLKAIRSWIFFTL